MQIRAFLLLLCFAGSVAAAPAEKPSGPSLCEQIQQPSFLAAYNAMIRGDAVPEWVGSFAKTFDGPEIPSVDILADGKIYSLGFTCKANDCGNNQLYVLFTGDGSQAWGMLLEGNQRRWLGNPDEKIKQTILSRLE